MANFAAAKSANGNEDSLMRLRWKMVIPLAVWLIIFLSPVPAGLQTNQWRYFAVFAAVVAGLIIESMPAGAVGLIGVTVAAVFGYVNPDPATSLRWALAGFSESTVWLVIGAFVFSIGYRKSGLGRRIALLLVRLLGKHTLGLGYAVSLADLALAPATPSNTARSAGIIYPIVCNIPKIYGSERGPTAKKIGTYLMWTAFTATAVTSSLFLTALAPNVAALAITKTTVGIEVSWTEWFSGFAPLGLLLVLLTPALSYLVCRPLIKRSPEISEWAELQLKAMGPLSRSEWVMCGLIVLAMFLWITGSNPNIALPGLGSNYINATAVVFVIVALLLVTEVVTFDDIITERSLWEVFLYFASLFTLASGLNETGFIKWAAEGFAKPLTSLAPLWAMVLLVAFFFWSHYLFSSITAHVAAVLPVILAVGAGIPGLPMRTLTLLCLYSLGLMGVISPYATGPAPIYFGSGYIERRDFWAFGFLFGLTYFAGLLLIVGPWLS